MMAPPAAAPVKKGGNTTLYIVIFFLCAISVMAGVFYFQMQSAAAKAASELEKIQADTTAKMAAAQSDFEKQQIQADASEKTREAQLRAEFTGKEAALDAKAKGKEAQLKALEAKVNADLAAAAKTVKNANELRAKATFEKNTAAIRLREAEAAKANADASGKAIDKKLADEKAMLAAEANVKVAAADARAQTAAATAKAEASKALSMKSSLEHAAAEIRRVRAQSAIDVAKARGDAAAVARAQAAAAAASGAASAAKARAALAARSAAAAKAARINNFKAAKRARRRSSWKPAIASVNTPSGTWRQVGINRDYPGKDVFHLYAGSNPKASTGSCLSRCASMSNCKYVTMNKAGTLCWGKSSLGKSSPNTDRINYVKPAALGKSISSGGMVGSGKLRKVGRMGSGKLGKVGRMGGGTLGKVGSGSGGGVSTKKARFLLTTRYTKKGCEGKVVSDLTMNPGTSLGAVIKRSLPKGQYACCAQIENMKIDRLDATLGNKKTINYKDMNVQNKMVLKLTHNEKIGGGIRTVCADKFDGTFRISQ